MLWSNLKHFRLYEENVEKLYVLTGTVKKGGEGGYF